MPDSFMAGWASHSPIHPAKAYVKETAKLNRHLLRSLEGNSGIGCFTTDLANLNDLRAKYAASTRSVLDARP
jgi:hypothetical protein